MNKEAGRFYLSCARLPRGARHYEKAAEIMEAIFMRGRCSPVATGRSASGKTSRCGEDDGVRGQKGDQQDPSNGAALGILAGGYALLGDEERTREWIARAMLIDPDNLNMRYNFACVLAGHLGDKDGAIRMLQSTRRPSAASRSRSLETDTDLDSLRDDPSFQKLLADAKKRLGLENSPELVSSLTKTN